MRKIVVACLGLIMAAASGCESDSSPEDGLQGVWCLSLASNAAMCLSFDDNRYSAGTGATSGQFELELGTFTATEDKLTTTPKQSTCDTTAAPSTVSYEIDGKILRIFTPDGILVFEKTAPTDSSGLVTYGCLVDGSFKPSPLKNL